MTDPIMHPDIVSHPGEMIRCNLEELNMSVADAANALQITRQQLYNVISGKSAISPEMALRFEMAFGSTAEMWLRVQAAYDLVQARRQMEGIDIPRLTKKDESR